MQVPDYSRQLDEIIKILNHPATPAWLIAAFSAVLGVVGGLVGQSLQLLATDAYRRYKMRRVLYLDLADMFLTVDSIMRFTELPDPDRWHWQEDQLRNSLLFRGEKYCLDNHEIYMQLPERLVGEALYSRFHRILDEEHSMNVNTDLALRMFANFVSQGGLKFKYFKRFLGSRRAVALSRAFDHHQTRDEELRRRLQLT